jgi:uridine kinase
MVITISAVSGGGKTTTTEYLANTLSQAKALYFDDYSFEGEPDDIGEWAERGGDRHEWNLSPLVRDLQLLQNNHPPLCYILLDYPFAYSHEQMKPYIDYTVFIDTPLDVAMARRILRDQSEGSLEQVRMEMANYLTRGRPAYLHMLETIKPQSDFVVDGTLPLADIADRIMDKVTTLRGFTK